jgi:hypothetical protein
MRAILLAAALALSACAPASLPDSPAEVADSTVLDEKAAIGAELSYTAAAKAAALAIRSGAVTSPATIKRIGELDRQAYAAVVATRAAYSAGNADSYAEAFTTAQQAVTDLLAAF